MFREVQLLAYRQRSPGRLVLLSMELVPDGHVEMAGWARNPTFPCTFRMAKRENDTHGGEVLNFLTDVMACAQAARAHRDSRLGGLRLACLQYVPAGIDSIQVASVASRMKLWNAELDDLLEIAGGRGSMQ